MARPDPADYEWLTEADTPPAAAGCITVIPSASVAEAAHLFGSNLGLATDPDRDGEEVTAAFGSTADGASFVLERNGYQGTRPEILKPASKASPSGKAASIFWNTEGIVVFTCASRGRIAATVDLLDALDDPEIEIPRSVRTLLARAPASGNLVALGAAMVEQFTGVRLTKSDVVQQPSMHLRIIPPADELKTDASIAGRLRHSHPRIVDAIARMDPMQQRRLAELLAETTFDQASMSANREAVQEVIAQFGTARHAVVTPRARSFFDRCVSTARKAWADWTADGTEDPPGLEIHYFEQLSNMSTAFRYACHPDPLTAALGTTRFALESLRQADVIDGAHARVRPLERYLESLTPDDQQLFGNLAAVLPPSLSPSDRVERTEHLRRRIESNRSVQLDRADDL